MPRLRPLLALVVATALFLVLAPAAAQAATPPKPVITDLTIEPWFKGCGINTSAKVGLKLNVSARVTFVFTEIAPDLVELKRLPRMYTKVVSMQAGRPVVFLRNLIKNDMWNDGKGGNWAVTAIPYRPPFSIGQPVFSVAALVAVPCPF